MAEDSHDNEKNLLEEAVEQFVDAQLRGEEPAIDEFIRKYPRLECRLRKRIQKLRKIDTIFASLVKTDESELEYLTDEQDIVGKKIGSFQIEKIIGRGGMGVVYLVRDTKLKRFVAFKSIPRALAHSSTVRTRFRREAELLASLNHPNIAVIHDIIEQDNHSGYLVLEYIEGETLSERIAREPLELSDALSIGRQIAEAVSAAHKKGIIHRDLKPGNIKITPDGRIKVLDFGLAKLSSSEDMEGEITETQTGRIIGTPAYMSPEQARGKDADHRTDIWSFGCIMYQMLTGRLPFEGETATDTLAKIIEHEPDFKALPKGTPTKIQTLLQQCFVKDPQRRLADIADAAAEIKEAQNIPLRPFTTRLLRIAVTMAVTIIIILSAIALWSALTKDVLIPSKQIRIAVLPFENLGPADDEYFADGITDEITARLASIHGLGIISRQSAMQYKKSEKDTRQIAEELGVDYILEGTVQREHPSDPNGHVRIRPQLINTSDDIHVWAQIYDENMSEIFRVQSDVAQQVSQALGITLLETERLAFASIPTTNMEAWTYYLQGNDYFDRDFHENFIRIAIQMWEQAVALDPQFTLAYANLSHAYCFLYWNHGHNAEDIEKAGEYVQIAVRLDPDLPEVHSAQGHYYYHGLRDYERALQEFAIVLKSRPHDDGALSWIGWVYKRQGKFEQALENIKRAYEFSPRRHVYPLHIGLICEWLDYYEQAEYFYNQTISLAPDRPRGYIGKMKVYLRQGRIKDAKAVQKEFSPYPDVVNDLEVEQTLIDIDVYEKNYQAALDRLASSPETEDFSNRPYCYLNEIRRAQIYHYWGKEDIAREHYEKARDIFERQFEKYPKDSGYQSMLGIIYAGLGLREEAILAGEEAVRKLPISKDAGAGPWRVQNLAQIYTTVGEYDKAIDQIEILLEKPSELSIPFLKLDPAWALLRDHPRFKKLVSID